MDHGHHPLYHSPFLLLLDHPVDLSEQQVATGLYMVALLCVFLPSFPSSLSLSFFLDKPGSNSFAPRIKRPSQPLINCLELEEREREREREREIFLSGPGLIVEHVVNAILSALSQRKYSGF